MGLPPRHRYRGGHSCAWLPVHLHGPQVRGRAGWMLRIPRGRPDCWLAADHGPHLHAGVGHGLCIQAADRGRRAGDIALDGLWVRYDDPETKTFKLNAERQNGRAAMLGITGCLIHELLGVDALYPTGGLGGAAPPTIF